jgi:HAD superfamily hydrolase (TIGR01549 family)
LPVEAVIFDLDGTIANFNLDYKTLRADVRSHLIRAGIPTSVLNVNENMFEMLKKAEIFTKNNNTPVLSFEKIRDQTLAIAEKYELEAASSTSLMPGAIESLKELTGMKLKIGLCTTSSEKAALYILHRFKIEQYFKVVVARDNVKYVKPSTEQFELALKTLDKKPKSVLIVGDSIIDMQSATELKVLAVGYPTGISTLEQLRDNGANFLITSLTDLPRLINEVNKS